MLALIRYMTLRSRGNSGGMQVGLKHSYVAIGATICFVAMVNAPNFLTYKITEMRLNETCIVRDESLMGAPAYLPGIAEIALAKHCLVKANRQRLLKNSRHTASPARNGKLTQGEKTHRTGSLRCNRGERADRTTNMLLAIVFVMLFTEMPQGIMALLSGMFSQEFRRHIYNNVGDLLDLLSLCEACMSFIIYCSMSGQFRNEFHRVFIPNSMHCTKRTPSVRRPSDAYTKMTYLRAHDLHNGSAFSDADRTTAVKV
uniref:G_PROTEIN_RECEP_F1_2 domain-containing protein n=1 Tax=Heterorhabditis bacteriophora TaxID=37862 RepID=A0A1I7XN18_HETBA